MIELGQHGDRHLVAPLVERAQILHVALGKSLLSLLGPSLSLNLRLLPTLLVGRFVGPNLVRRLMCRLWPCLRVLVVPAGTN